MENNNNENNIKQYEIDKKYQMMQSVSEKKMEMSSMVKVGDTDLASISLLADKFTKAGDLVPKEYQGHPEKCFAAIYKGASLGLDAFTALQRIAVVNQRATIWGDTGLALVRKSGLMTKFKEEISEHNGKLTATCTVRRAEEDEHTEVFSQEDAERAGLWNRNVWKTHPKRMLKYKARAFALRDIFPDILDGLHFKEEMEGESVTPRPGSVSDVTPQKTVVVKEILDVEDQTRELFSEVKDA